jgi:hypothetical protein
VQEKEEEVTGATGLEPAASGVIAGVLAFEIWFFVFAGSPFGT